MLGPRDSELAAVGAPGEVSVVELPTDAFPVADAGGAVKRRLGPLFWVSTGWVALMAAAAILAPVLPLHDPNKVADGPQFVGFFKAAHLLGTDKLGRDLLARTVWGSRVSLVIGVAAVLFGLLIGGTMGLIAGFYRGWLDRVLMATVDVLLAFPAVVLLLAIVTFMGRDLWKIVLAAGILSIAPIARLARANTIQWAQREFVMASQTLGAKRGRILVREVLPNVVMPMASLALIGVAIIIVAEGTLAFLGLSVNASISWGKMIVDGRESLDIAPQIAFAPAIAMFLTVLALNFAGDRIRAYFDVREGAL